MKRERLEVVRDERTGAQDRRRRRHLVATERRARIDDRRGKFRGFYINIRKTLELRPTKWASEKGEFTDHMPEK